MSLRQPWCRPRLVDRIKVGFQAITWAMTLLVIRVLRRTITA